MPFMSREIILGQPALGCVWRDALGRSEGGKSMLFGHKAGKGKRKARERSGQHLA